MFPLRSLASAVLVLLVTTCSSIIKHQPKGLGMLQRDGKSIVAIGCVSGVDKDLHKLIKEVLHGRGIWSTYEGSMMYDIFVHTDDEGDAREILRTDPRLAGKQIMALP